MHKKLKKGTKLIFCALGGALIGLSVSLAVICHSRTLCAGEIGEEKAYRSVLSDIENISAANPRVVDLAMLGSHDANTCNLESAESYGTEIGTSLKMIYKIAPGLSLRFTKTQVSTIYDQLCQGTRYFDFRCSYYHDEWYGSHSLIDKPLRVCIEDVIRFLTESPGEIATLNFKLVQGEENAFPKFISEIFDVNYHGYSLWNFMPYENIPLGELTYNDVTRSGKQGGVVAFFKLLYPTDGIEEFDYFYSRGYYQKIYYDGYLEEYDDYVEGVWESWSGSAIYSVWHNRMNTSSLAEALNKQYALMRKDFRIYSDRFRVMQMQTSPNARDIFETARAWSLICKAKQHNFKILSNPDFDNWLKTMPIVLCDFVTSQTGDFNKNVNEKIISYNRKTVEKLLLKQ